MLPKRRHAPDTSPDHEWECVSEHEVQLVDETPSIIVEPDSPSLIVEPESPSLSPMALDDDLEDTVIPLTRRSRPPASTRPSAAWTAAIFLVSAVSSAAAVSVLRLPGAPAVAAPMAAAAQLVASPPPMPTPPVAMFMDEQPEPVSISVSELPTAELVTAVVVPPRAPARPIAKKAPPSPPIAQADAGREELDTSPSSEAPPVEEKTDDGV